MSLDIRVGGGKCIDDLRVDRGDHLVEFATRIFDVFELALQEPMAFLQCGELFSCQRIDRAKQTQLTIELSTPATCIHAGWKCWTLSDQCFCGQRIAITGERIDSRLATNTRFSRFDFQTLASFAERPERALQIFSFPTNGREVIKFARRYRCTLIARSGDRRSCPGETVEAALQGRSEPRECEVFCFELAATLFKLLTLCPTSFKNLFKVGACFEEQ
jgi:hypothetical protein